VGIDRAEDPDAADHRPDRPAPPDDPTEASKAVLADAQQRAELQRSYHARVDHTYDTTRSGCTEALPDLRAAWEKHVENYPEGERPVPSTLPDGSWTDGSDRRLTPERNADASEASADIHTEGKEAILPAMRRVEAADPDRHLSGLEHMLKGEDRLKEKIADILFVESDLSVRQALAKVPDAVRFTLTYGQQRYAEGVLSDVERLKSEGFELVRLKNLWPEEQYKGINSQWRNPETGLRFEVQFHTPESLAAKQLTHKAYERLRSTGITQAERDELAEYQRRAYVAVPIPPGSASIKEFPITNGRTNHLLRDALRGRLPGTSDWRVPSGQNRPRPDRRGFFAQLEVGVLAASLFSRAW